MAFIAWLKSPIAALIHSEGKSIHAWIKMKCKSMEEYKFQAAKILFILKKYGFDQAIKNPSRMGRFPGNFFRVFFCKISHWLKGLAHAYFF